MNKEEVFCWKGSGKQLLICRNRLPVNKELLTGTVLTITLSLLYYTNGCTPNANLSVSDEQNSLQNISRKVQLMARKKMNVNSRVRRKVCCVYSLQLENIIVANGYPGHTAASSVLLAVTHTRMDGYG